MTLRTKFFIILGIFIAFIIFVAVMLMRGKNDATPKTIATPSVTASLPRDTNVIAVPTSPTEETKIADAESFARSFVERLGSFSNQSNYENIRELRSLMTPTMQAWADRTIADARAKATKDAPYYGITTRALQASAKENGGGIATVVVKTTRREVKGKDAPRVFYQDMALVLKKVDGEWKAESATWK